VFVLNCRCYQDSIPRCYIFSQCCS